MKNAGVIHSIHRRYQKMGLDKDKIDWKNTLERKEFEESIEFHKGRLGRWSSSQTVTWLLGVFLIPGVMVVVMYGSAAYILVTSAWDTKARKEELMREEWIAERQVKGGLGMIIKWMNNNR